MDTVKWTVVVWLGVCDICSQFIFTIGLKLWSKKSFDYLCLFLHLVHIVHSNWWYIFSHINVFTSWNTKDACWRIHTFNETAYRYILKAAYLFVNAASRCSRGYIFLSWIPISLGLGTFFRLFLHSLTSICSFSSGPGAHLPAANFSLKAKLIILRCPIEDKKAIADFCGRNLK